VYDALGQPVFQEVSSLDQRLAELQSQLDRLAVSLQLWREQHDHLEPAEQRLAALTRQCADIVSQWSTTNERQARAVRQLEERVSAFSDAEERLHSDASERLRALERVIEQEWSALRQLHRAPVEELKEHAATLGQVSVAAANTSLSGMERAEARLAALERTLNDRLTGVSRQLETAVAEIRALVPGRGEALPPSWPIEGVMRLHNQLREPAAGPGVITVQPSSAPSAGSPWALPPALSDAAPRNAVETGAGRPPSRARSGERVDESDAESPLSSPSTTAPVPRKPMLLAGAIAAAVITLAAIGSFVMQRQARAAVVQASQAQQQAQAAVAMATSQVAAARDEAAREVAQAREGSARAQMVSDVLASPDLIRFNIAGQGPGAITGQVLWSRSRGVVFSGLRVPPAPPRMTYQLWLLTEGAPVTAGTFTPDATGRVTFSTEPPRVPRAVVGAALTLEPAGGSATPSDRLLGQNRRRPAPAPAAAPAPPAAPSAAPAPPQ
jgi:anti-sigma-K factor RskA